MKSQAQLWAQYHRIADIIRDKYHKLIYSEYESYNGFPNEDRYLAMQEAELDKLYQVNRHVENIIIGNLMKAGAVPNFNFSSITDSGYMIPTESRFLMDNPPIGKEHIAIVYEL